MRRSANEDNFLGSEGFGPHWPSPALRRVMRATERRRALVADLLLQIAGVLAAGLVLHTFL